MANSITKFFKGLLPTTLEPLMRYKIEIVADNAFLEALQTLADETKQSREDVIRAALGIYQLAIEQRIKHNKGIVFQEFTNKSLTPPHD